VDTFLRNLGTNVLAKADLLQGGYLVSTSPGIRAVMELATDTLGSDVVAALRSNPSTYETKKFRVTLQPDQLERMFRSLYINSTDTGVERVPDFGELRGGRERVLNKFPEMGQVYNDTLSAVAAGINKDSAPGLRTLRQEAFKMRLAGDPNMVTFYENARIASNEYDQGVMDLLLWMQEQKVWGAEWYRYLVTENDYGAHVVVGSLLAIGFLAYNAVKHSYVKETLTDYMEFLGCADGTVASRVPLQGNRFADAINALTKCNAALVLNLTLPVPPGPGAAKDYLTYVTNRDQINDLRLKVQAIINQAAGTTTDEEEIADSGVLGDQDVDLSDLKRTGSASRYEQRTRYRRIANRVGPHMKALNHLRNVVLVSLQAQYPTSRLANIETACASPQVTEENANAAVDVNAQAMRDQQARERAEVRRRRRARLRPRDEGGRARPPRSPGRRFDAQAADAYESVDELVDRFMRARGIS
jgi:hypothetical protein